MRFDSVGIFWQDADKVRSRDRISRVMPPIPATDWQPVRDLPNLSRAKVISIDTETNDESLELNLGPGWARGVGNIAGISIGADYDGRWYFPIRHTIEPENNYEPGRILSWLQGELNRPHQPKVLANALYDLGWLRQEGVSVSGELHDVQFAEALLDSDAFVSLEALSAKYLGEHKQSDTVMQWCADYYGGRPDLSQRCNLWRAPGRLVAPYAIGDADLPVRILDKQWPLLLREGLFDLYRMECDLIPLLLEMRFAGVRVDIKRAEEVKGILEAKEKVLAGELRSIVGFDVNVDAGESIAKAFDKFGLQYPLTPKSKKPSFKKDFLKSVQHPIAGLVREIRKVTKTRSTFIESYFLNSHVNGKIYPSIHPLKSDENGTVTGRFAMSNPNGQNLPSKDEEMGLLVRGCAIPDDGHKQWRKYDWSQLQYRFLAHYAVGPDGDDSSAIALRNIFNTDPKADYHATVQGLVEKITGQRLDRKPVKNINFGFVFGMGIAHLAEMLGLELSAAKELAETYHLGVPYVKATLAAASKEAQTFGIITTVLGRKTRFNLWEPKQFSREADPEKRSPALPYEHALREYGRIRRAYTHKALNYKLQGSEGDLMKYCMLRAWKEGVFAATGVPRLTVHDELDFSDTGESDDAFDYLHHEIMENSLQFRVPISAGCDVGPNWGACL